MSDPNVPPLLYGLVILAILVIYAYGGLVMVAITAALADLVMRRIEIVRARQAVRVRLEHTPANK